MQYSIERFIRFYQLFDGSTKLYLIKCTITTQFERVLCYFLLLVLENDDDGKFFITKVLTVAIFLSAHHTTSNALSLLIETIYLI